MFSASKGTTDGEAVFVFVDCAKGGLLQNTDIPQVPPAVQPAAIFYPGVFTGSKA